MTSEWLSEACWEAVGLDLGDDRFSQTSSVHRRLLFRARPVGRGVGAAVRKEPQSRNDEALIRLRGGPAQALAVASGSCFSGLG